MALIWEIWESRESLEFWDCPSDSSPVFVESASSSCLGTCCFWIDCTDLAPIVPGA